MYDKLMVNYRRKMDRYRTRLYVQCPGFENLKLEAGETMSMEEVVKAFLEARKSQFQLRMRLFVWPMAMAMAMSLIAHLLSMIWIWSPAINWLLLSVDVSPHKFAPNVMNCVLRSVNRGAG